MTTWNPADKSSNVVLTNGNLQMLTNTAADGGVRSDTSKSSGKYYFEFYPADLTGTRTGFGLATGTADLTLLGGLGAGGVIVHRNGLIYYNSAYTGKKIGTIASTDTVCFAIDYGNKLLWVRRNAGTWNGDATAEPSTATGGISISTVFTGAIFAAAAANNTLVNVSINFGPPQAYLQAIPSGFSSWDPIPSSTVALYQKYNDFSEQACRGKHDFGSHVFKVALSNGTPSAAHTMRSDISELATGNGYTVGGITTAITIAEASGITTVTASDCTWTPSGAGITYRYAALYNDTQTSPADPLVGYWDNGGSVTVGPGNTLKVDFGTELFTLY